MEESLIHEKIKIDILRTDYFKKQVLVLISHEPRLEDLIMEGLAVELRKARLDVIPGLGGWAKCRLPSPSQRQGKRGGFRLIFLFYRVGQIIFLGDLYYKREQANIHPKHVVVLKNLAKEIKVNDKGNL